MEKLHWWGAASAPPPAERVPAGTVTLYSVAIGMRWSGWKTRVLVPIQRQRPATFGSIWAGAIPAASSA